MSDEPATPQHDKIAALKGDNDTIGAFLEWLGESPYTICQWSEFDRRYYPARVSIEELLAQYFGIDLPAFRAEKEAIYQQIAAHARTQEQR